MITNNGSIQNAELIKEYLTNLAINEQLYLAVGTGSDSWDTQLPTTNKNTTKLVNEIYRIKISSNDIVSVEVSDNADNDTIVSSSNTIRIHGDIVCPMQPLREYGLFINASDAKDSGTLYSYDVHSKIVLGQLNLYMKYIYINF